MGLTVEKCLQAWTNSLEQMNAKADIVFFGDSLIYYGDFAPLFPDKVVCNLGLRGDTIQGMNNRVKQLKILNPKIVCVMAGINDVASNSSLQFVNLYDNLINHIRQEVPFSKIVVFSLLPVNNIVYPISCNCQQIRECNKQILALAEKYKIQYVDLFSIYVKDDVLPIQITKDGLHLIQGAYRMWYEELSNYQLVLLNE